jgi:hypothetical protein
VTRHPRASWEIRHGCVEVVFSKTIGTKVSTDTMV